MPNRYGDVVSRAFLFALGNGCIDRIIQFKVRLKRVHFFHIKIDRNPNAFQFADRFKPVHNLTSKAANAFYQHKIDFLLPAIAEHTLELCAILRAFSTGEIEVYIGQLPLVRMIYLLNERRDLRRYLTVC